MNAKNSLMARTANVNRFINTKSFPFHTDCGASLATTDSLTYLMRPQYHQRGTGLASLRQTQTDR